ncbi:MAG: aldehyde ferredoxin oxidoreductase family protein [Gammaproteobacteria bacterium]|nr:aldehyde ferredoxin oxidoreductase family protein [Gammaproteobacteria bacterium]
MSWQNKVLFVDLTANRCWSEPLNQRWAEKYVGTRGLGTRYLMDLIDPSVDPMSPENVLIFATGPLTGTSCSTSGRWTAICKSPLTNSIGSANSGGKFGAELKFAGYDLLIVKGRAKQPVYLFIDDDNVEIRPADMWGQSVWEADEAIRKEVADPNIKIAAIGQSGENGARIACIVNDLHRAAGRCGVGAVMGSKQLKAVAVRGSQGVGNVADPKRFMQLNTEIKAKVAADKGRQGMTRNGTHAMLSSMQAFGGLPTRNFREVQFEGADKIDHVAARTATDTGHVNLQTNKACFGCTIACGRIAKIDPEHFSVKDRPQYHTASGGLEYETAYAFGPVVGVDDIDALTFAAFVTNEYGLDPISFGVTLAAAMELHELGVLPAELTDGIELKFGSAEALCVMAEKTGKAEGFGVELGMGAKRLTEKYGHPELFMGSKGQEFAGYDARAMQGMGLGYATSNRGACHLKHDVFSQDMKDHTSNGKAEPCKRTQDIISAVDATGLCLFINGYQSFEDFAALMDAACGGWDADKLQLTGERIWNLEKLFNLKAGLTRADDSLPPRMLNDAVPTGSAKGSVCELDKLLDEYYELRGWNPDSTIKADTLARLGLTELA